MYKDFLQGAVFIERHGGVVEQVGVDAEIHAASREQAVDMFLQLLAADE